MEGWLLDGCCPCCGLFPVRRRTVVLGVRRRRRRCARISYIGQYAQIILAVLITGAELLYCDAGGSWGSWGRVSRRIDNPPNRC
ncbi:hypothetical protein BU16DRAFT_387710 [Lophium mytilinum]|uniref:Uncharacterized protein n=1 Tax=Lophium mytilinum TaxID=390894 RepID=A0A6A6QSI5_9PEZI|nr:hypothetical protein BU16DRAFT_387710 [Lophium mytilinum]